jgi:hypothetical protein
MPPNIATLVARSTKAIDGGAPPDAPPKRELVERAEAAHRLAASLVVQPGEDGT